MVFKTMLFKHLLSVGDGPGTVPGALMRFI